MLSLRVQCWLSHRALAQLTWPDRLREDWQFRLAVVAGERAISGRAFSFANVPIIYRSQLRGTLPTRRVPSHTSTLA
jgi:hypothetical protein